MRFRAWPAIANNGMTETSWRSAPLPPGWAKLRTQCRDRAEGRCQALDRDSNRCIEAGNEAHHVDRDNHDSLVWLCAWHHNRITQQQAAAARTGKTVTDRRPPEKHPGLR